MRRAEAESETPGDIGSSLGVAADRQLDSTSRRGQDRSLGSFAVDVFTGDALHRGPVLVGNRRVPTGDESIRRPDDEAFVDGDGVLDFIQISLETRSGPAAEVPPV